MLLFLSLYELPLNFIFPTYTDYSLLYYSVSPNLEVYVCNSDSDYVCNGGYISLGLLHSNIFIL